MFRNVCVAALVVVCTISAPTFGGEFQGVVKAIPTRHFKGTPVASWPVTKIPVKVGDQVKAGQLLLELDPAVLPLERAQAQWNSAKKHIEAVKSRLQTRKVILERSQKLVKTNACSQEQQDEARETVEVLERELEQAKSDEAAACATFRMAKYNFDTYERVTSLIDGRVVAINCSLGMAARPEDKQLDWIEVLDTSEVDVSFKANDQEIREHGFRVGKVVRITGTEPVEGKISAILSQVLDEQGKTEILVRVANPKGILRVNERVTVNPVKRP